MVAVEGFLNLCSTVAMPMIQSKLPQSREKMFVNRKMLWGVLMIVVSAIGYGLQPVFGKLAFAEGIAPATITFGRFLLAVIFFEIHYLFLPKGGGLRAKETMTTVGIGIVFAAAAFCYYISLQYLSPVVFSFIYYTYPLMTLFVGVLLFSEKITGAHVGATVFIISGTALLLSGGEIVVNPVGVFWILACALCMAFFFQLQRFLPRKRCELHHARIMIRVMAAIFFVWWIFAGTPNWGMNNVGLWWVFLIGFISTYVAFTASVIGIARLGANYAALLSGQEPLWTVLFSFAILGLALHATQWVGAVIMLSAIFLINYFGMKGKRN